VTYRLVIRPEAGAEVDEAARWYEERSQGLGQAFLDTFLEVTANVKRSPHLYASVLGEAHRALLHKFPYSVIYEIDGDEVVVLACFHERRDPKEWQRRL
jgi:plasmid stabilization system protein ParE